MSDAPQVPKGDAEIIRDSAVASVGFTSINKSGMPTVILPPGYKAEAREDLLLAPVRKRGGVAVHSAESFCDYVIVHGAPGTIYADQSRPAFVAILNDHQTTDPGWGDHRVTYPCPLSRQWGLWNEHDGKARTQTDFAQFIEENLDDIMAVSTTDPSAAEMLEIATGLQAKSESNFTSAVRLDNGDINFSYREQTEANAPGQLRVPDHFSLRIPIFRHADPSIVKARLRYRIKEGSLSMWYSLVRPDELLDVAFERVATKIRERCDMAAFYYGTPRG
jgi:uncharacterized protein YfdQ (DUF2303 family)